MLTFTAKSLARRWRRTAIIVLVMAVPLIVYGAVYPVGLASYSRLQAYSSFTAGYVIADTGITYSGGVPSVYISNQNISTMNAIGGVRDAYGILNVGIMVDLHGEVEANLEKSNCSQGLGLFSNLPSGIKSIALGGSIIAFNTSAITQTALPYQIVSGRFPGMNETDAVAINTQTYQCLRLNPGDSISVYQAIYSSNSTKPQWENATLHVVGVYTTPPIFGPDVGTSQMPSGIMGLNAALTRFPAYSGRYSSTWVVVSDVKDVNNVGDDIRGMFPKLHVYYPSSLVQQTANLLDIATETYNIITILALISAVLVIFFVGIYDLQGRLPDLGLYTSQGWTRSSVLKYELQLSALSGVLGGVFAVVLSFVLGKSIAGMFGFQEITPALTYQASYYALADATIMVVALAVSLFSSYVGLRRAMKRMPIELLRR